ncbi:MAG: aminotransferase class I/II-fold pyridoxal phosphate-dependent enzyme [Clostridia bacterium]|nr:aminotransferase class I/II-fold pyridoxal phosphate-dependent enzyme [Clostridia bacterium]
MNFRLEEIDKAASAALGEVFAEVDRIAFKNTVKVMDAFREFKVSEAHFAPTSGYGYDDKGRDTLDKIYAKVFDAEAAFVRHSIVNGTHALTIGLSSLLRPGDIMLSVTGKPYDTLEEVIGIRGEAGNGSLADFGIEYREVTLKNNGDIDFEGIKNALDTYGKHVKVVFIQRSKGYMIRPTLTVDQIGEIVKRVKAQSEAYVVVDNCYGEFVEEKEPTSVGADMIIGSLIKNPGGGMAESGGYIAGSARAVELASYRLTSVGIGLECGASLGQTKSMYKGFFMAPHIVAQAIKTAHYAAYVFDALGYETEPKYNEKRSDIIQIVRLGSEEKLIAFCGGIQSASPVDSYVAPMPWAMPGYADQVIMAAGAFTSGSSIELSADAPVREPYPVYMQGGLTFEAGKLGILSAAERVLKCSEH